MENINIWFLADTHFGMKSDDDECLNDSMSYFKKVLIPIMRKRVRKGDILVHCGDVFDNRTTVGINTLTKVIELFEEFSEIFDDIRIVVGNHDSNKKSSNEVTSVNMLKHIPNVKVYYTPEIEDIGGRRCLFNPWIEDQNKQKELLKDMDVDYVFGHLNINGSLTINRSGCRVSISSNVDGKDFKNAQVYAGHIHARQDMKNVHYVGTPYHKDRGDIGTVKGITVLDIMSGECEFIENTYSPKYISDSIYDILNITVGELKELWKNNYVDLHLSGKDCVICNFDDLREVLSNCFKSFNVIGDTVINEDESVEGVDFKNAKMSDDYIDDYVDTKDLDDDFKKRVFEKIEEYKNRL